MGIPGQETAETLQEYSLFVDKLDRNVNDKILFDLFVKKYPSVISAKVMTDPLTKKSKCYGFIKFHSYEESVKAVKEMDGYSLFGKNIKISQQQSQTQSG